MATYRKGKIEAIEKEQTLRLQMDLPMTELIAGVRDDIEALAAQIGLTIMKAVMKREAESQLGQWGQQKAYRHGQQRGMSFMPDEKLPCSVHGSAAKTTRKCC